MSGTDLLVPLVLFVLYALTVANSVFRGYYEMEILLDIDNVSSEYRQAHPNSTDHFTDWAEMTNASVPVRTFAKARAYTRGIFWLFPGALLLHAACLLAETGSNCERAARDAIQQLKSNPYLLFKSRKQMRLRLVRLAKYDSGIAGLEWCVGVLLAMLLLWLFVYLATLKSSAIEGLHGWLDEIVIAEYVAIVIIALYPSVALYPVARCNYYLNTAVDDVLQPVEVECIRFISEILEELALPQVDEVDAAAVHVQLEQQLRPALQAHKDLVLGILQHRLDLATAEQSTARLCAEEDEARSSECDSAEEDEAKRSEYDSGSDSDAEIDLAVHKAKLILSVFKRQFENALHAITNALDNPNPSQLRSLLADVSRLMISSEAAIGKELDADVAELQNAAMEWQGSPPHIPLLNFVPSPGAVLSLFILPIISALIGRFLQ